MSSSLAHDPSLEDLLAPVSAEEFFARYWERERLHLSRNRPDFYDGLFSLGDVDRWVVTNRNSSSKSLTVKASEGPPVRSGRPGEIALDKLYEDFQAGHSIILRAMHEGWSPLSPLVSMLEGIFQARVNVNLYLSPSGSRVFPRHIDYHDFFIFQIHGAKDWTLYEFDYLPMERLEYGGAFPAFREGTNRDTPVLEELRLEQGDMLYVPRGMPHKAAAAGSEPSLHLTVSFHPLYWADLLKAAVEEVAVRETELQRSLPPRFALDPAIQRDMADRFAAALAAVARQASFETVFDAVLKRQVATPRQLGDGHFEQLVRMGDLTPETELERRAGVLCRIESNGEQATLHFGVSQMSGPAYLVPAFELIRDRPRFRIAELPGLSDNSRLVLSRRLIQQGLLRVPPGA